ncbi:hypothetical protein IPN35_00980 [Candidatus Peregrinibacteria bacterium]|nr:MAG: hypothetical protein IPN35_00980 [Candidatus Peregrinibacteria bacterium]
MSHIDQNKRGSQWRKWDLHVHTPFTKMSDEFKLIDSDDLKSTTEDDKKWEKFFKVLSEKETSVVGITDYFSINNYRTVLEKKGSFDSTVKFFPNIEFRIAQKNKDSEFIQIHVIFSDSIDVKRIGNFLTRLPLISTDDQTLKNKFCTDSDLSEVTYERAMVNHEKLKECLEENFTKIDEYLIVGVARGYGCIRPASDDDGRGGEYAKEIDKICHIFYGNADDVDFYLNKIEGRSQYSLSQKSVFLSSDAHCYNDIGEKFTWVKANPTFEGLKQVVYEPEDRVEIQKSEPEEKTGYQVIDRVEINHNHVFNKKLELNFNLNSIIGGRSTGKSILLAAIAKKLKIENLPEFHDKEYENYINEISVNLKVFWKDGKEDNGREVEYFKQGYMYDLARNESKLSSLIQNILRKKGKDIILDNYFSIINENKKKISSSVDDFFQILEEIKLKEDSISDKGDKKGVEDEISKLAGELKIFNTEEITEEEIKEYEKNKLIIEKGNETIIILQRDVLNIEKLKGINLIQDSLEYELTSVSDANKDIIIDKFKNLKEVFQKGWLKEIEDLKQKITKEEKDNEKKIKEATENTTYAKVVKIFSQSEHLKEIEGKIKKEKDKLLVITTLLDEVKKLKDQKEKLKKSIKALHENYLLEINKLIPLLSSSAEGLEIKAKKIFKEKECGEFLESGMNKTFSTNHKYLYLSGTLEGKMIEIFNDLTESKLELKAGYTNKTLANRLLSENFYKIEYDLIYENDDFHKMSDGKKSFVVLKLLLDFSDKDCPILIDQPEDDLDNRSIYSDLVSYLKKKKKLRQIIVATHNPNLVVGADAECVIVANQHGEKSKNHDDKKFEYIQGALENTFLSEDSDYVLEKRGIQEHVCDILEGGRIAFEQRKKKYSL